MRIRTNIRPTVDTEKSRLMGTDLLGSDGREFVFREDVTSLNNYYPPGYDMTAHCLGSRWLVVDAYEELDFPQERRPLPKFRKPKRRFGR